MENKKEKGLVLGGALLIGIGVVLLAYFGNPLNMALCSACFIRDIAGSLGFHQSPKVMYFRPEIPALLIGSLIASVAFKEFKPKGSSAPLTRFILSIVVMIGALIFLGCSFRLVLRLAGGDLNALVGLSGLIVGILVGILFIKKGFSLPKSRKETYLEASIMPVISIVLLAAFAIVPSAFFLSKEAPGNIAAPVVASVLIALAIGFIAQRIRFCTIGAFKHIVLFRDFTMFIALVIVFVIVLIGNLFIFKTFNLSFVNQPIAHTNQLYNFLGLAILGWGSVLLGGCPLRQIVLSGQGNANASISIIGFIVGAAIAHNFKIAATPAGVTDNGKIAVLISIVILLVVSLASRSKE